MAERTGGKTHKYRSGSHNEPQPYNVKNAPEMSSANKIDPGKHHQAGYMPGIGGGHGSGHTPKGHLGELLPGHRTAKKGY